ncbi:MAG: DUF3429 domain-containing protein [Gammaproteobacteria bacterium]|nr:DUF3429 domain-containing protein [Gammaproteobacteria bacterium]
MLSSQRVTNALGYAGLIPFVVPASLITLGSEHSGLLTSLAGSYAFGIVCFLAGSWWGMGLLPGSRSALLLSNLYFLVAFFIFLFAFEIWALAAAVLLIGIFLAEQRSSLFPAFPASYSVMRTMLTLVASASMLAIHLAG